MLAAQGLNQLRHRVPRNTFIYIKDHNDIYRTRLQANFGGHKITNGTRTLTLKCEEFGF
jgi:hypothetical protein